MIIKLFKKGSHSTSFFIYPLFPTINFPFNNNKLSASNIKGILLCKYDYILVYQAF